MRFRRGRLSAASLVAALLATGCGFSLKLDSCPVAAGPPNLPAAASLQVQYLGVGGFLLRRGEDVLLTAPLYSNPSLLEVAAEHALRTDRELVERLLPREADAALGILVGHAHYDHLLDVPYVASRRARQATIYGSETVRRLLAFDPSLASRVVTVESAAGDHVQPGEWLPVGPRLRLMALRSHHSVQATLKLPLSDRRTPFQLWRGDERTDRRDEPRSASDWPQGEVFAYLVDFLGDGGEVLFRVYYQDSGTNQPVDTPAGRTERTGYPPPQLVAERRVDVAILCVGGDARRLRNHPAGIIAWTRPRVVILSHWEDFFVTQDSYAVDGRVFGLPSPALLEGNETRKFLRQAQDTLRRVDPAGRVWLPCPTRSSFVIAPSASR